MSEPVILKFPKPDAQIAPAAPGDSLPTMVDVDLQTILQAWNEATDRLRASLFKFDYPWVDRGWLKH